MCFIFFYSEWNIEGQGNKYIGPVRGNNKIQLIKLKETKGLQPAAGDSHQIFKKAG